MTTGVYTRKPKPIKERFEKLFIKSNGCWEWKRGLTPFGYGHFFMNSKVEQAHRASFMIYKGKIPKGICVCHTCDNRACVNPKHLWLGTRNDNIQDMIRKGRANKAPSEENGSAKLTWKEVAEIRRLYPIVKSTRRLATFFRIERRQISRIVRNLSWKI